MTLRPYRADDWPQIYPFFTAIVDAGETYAYPIGLDLDAARDLWVRPAPGHTVVAVEGERVLGTAVLSANRPGRGAHVATASFMVDPAAAGRGVGRALGSWVIEQARTDGYHGIQFNAVVETNHPAVHLWRALGFEIVGTVPGAFHHPEHGYVGLHVMYHDLGARHPRSQDAK